MDGKVRLGKLDTIKNFCMGKIDKRETEKHRELRNIERSERNIEIREKHRC